MKTIIEWMNRWIGRWKDGWMGVDGCMDDWMMNIHFVYIYIYIYIYIYMNGWMVEYGWYSRHWFATRWFDRLVYVWMQKNGQMDYTMYTVLDTPAGLCINYIAEWTDGCIKEQINGWYSTDSDLQQNDLIGL